MLLDAGQGHMMTGFMGWGFLWVLLLVLLIIVIVMVAAGSTSRPREDLLLDEIRRLRREVEELREEKKRE